MKTRSGPESLEPDYSLALLVIMPQVLYIESGRNVAYRTAGNVREVQNFAFFSRAIKTEINSHAPIFHLQSYWWVGGWVWFPGIETRILEPTNISAEGSRAN